MTQLTDEAVALAALRQWVVAFRDERDWRQFHRPKDLILALGIEAAELGELVLWRGDDEVDRQLGQAAFRGRMAEEMADVLAYLLLLSDATGIDLTMALANKLALNENKYPVDQARGNARKYSDLAGE